jgi:ubiquinone/menaquinone biosynthesis C-methylase UbiE
MSRSQKVDSKELGLIFAAILGQDVFKIEDLHYGYWTPDLPADYFNLARAQANYSQFLLSHIPVGVKTILDVGCGMGAMAQKLIGLGYQVDCVSPSLLLTQRVREKLGSSCRIFECNYEELETDNRYDLVLCSESFQYLNMEKAISQTLRFLNDKGYLLICDFFKTDAKGKSALSGGHRLSGFYSLISQHPFQSVEDIDITPQTAPTMTLVHNLLTHVGLPIHDMLFYFLKSNYPRVDKFLRWKYKKKIDKLNHKYFSGERDAAHFSIFKSYRLLIYQKVTGR